MEAKDVVSDPGVEALLERHAEALARGEAGALEELLAELDEPERRSRFRAAAVAQEYLAKTANLETVAIDDFLQRLEGKDEREVFFQVLDDASCARSRLPGELLPGTVLDGRYEIRREVGRGGMGIVYAAFDRGLEREVAIKILKLSPVAPVGNNWDELFWRESRTLARLESRNIVTIHDARRADDRTWIVMDLVRGRDLGRILNDVRAARMRPRMETSPEPWREAIGRAEDDEREDLLGEHTHARCAARILREIAATVERAHEAGVVHRDLKPQNVLLVPGGEPVLLDFGLASWSREALNEGFRGTPEYMAPEQIQTMRAGNDPRTDVYQLGLILYEMLALRRAFVRNGAGVLFPLFQKILAGQLTPLDQAAPRIPRSLRAIVQRALARDPAHRYQTVRDLREDLDRFLARLPPKHVAIPVTDKLALLAAWLVRQPLFAIVLLLLVAAFFWLKEPPWAPPTMEVFRKEEGAAPVELVLGQPIEFGGECVLGVRVSAPSETWIYAFSKFGGGEEQDQFLSPVAPMLLSASNDRAPPVGPLFLEPGKHEVVCAALTNPDANEGLLVFACAEEIEFIERWQQTLLEREKDLGPARWTDAMQLGLQLAASVRGERLASLSEDHRKRIFGEVQDGETAEQALGEDGDLKRYEYFFPVQRREEAPR